MNSEPRVGVGVIIKKDGKVLFGKRKGSHGAGDWCCPGGHLDFKESFEDCAIRETAEETGIKIKNIKFGAVTNDFFQNEDKHYITISIVADYDSGDVEIKEPDKCEEWGWFEWNSLPEPLFISTQNLLKQGYSPFEK